MACIFLNGVTSLEHREDFWRHVVQGVPRRLFSFCFITLHPGPRRPLSPDLNDKKSMSLKYEPASNQLAADSPCVSPPSASTVA